MEFATAEALLADGVPASAGCLLVDISMPGMGGIGFLRQIMLSNGALSYPVLVFTARTTTEDYFRGIPIDGFITKPCDKTELVGKMQGGEAGVDFAVISRRLGEIQASMQKATAEWEDAAMALEELLETADGSDGSDGSD